MSKPSPTPRAERREQVQRMLTESPDRSARSIARASGASHTHVGDIRRELISAGVIAAVSAEQKPATQASGNLLKQTPDGELLAERHGAYSERRVGPRRARILEELRQRFTGVDDDLLLVQAHRRAQLELLSDWVDEHGVIRGGKRGEITAAATFAERIAVSYERQHERLVELQSESETVDPMDALNAHLTEMAAKREALPAGEPDKQIDESEERDD